MKIVVIVTISILALTSCTQTQTQTQMPTVQQGPDAEVTFDGLHRVDNTQSTKTVMASLASSKR